MMNKSVSDYKDPEDCYESNRGDTSMATTNQLRNFNKKYEDYDTESRHSDTKSVILDHKRVPDNEEAKEGVFIPPRLKNNYEYLHEITTHAYFREHKVRSRKDGEIYRLRMLDLKSETEIDDRGNNLATNFVKEYTRFCSNYPDEVDLESLEITENLIVYVKKEGCQLQDKTPKEIAGLNLKKLIEDVLNDIYFLEKKMGLGYFSLGIENIYQSKKNGAYYVDYRKISNRRSIVHKNIDFKNYNMSHKHEEFEDYIYQLGLEMILVNLSDEGAKVTVRSNSEINHSVLHDNSIEIFVRHLGYLEESENLLIEMTRRDPKQRIKINKFIDNNNSKYFNDNAGNSENQILNSSFKDLLDSLQNPQQETIMTNSYAVKGTVLQYSEDNLIDSPIEMATGVLIGPNIVLTSGKIIFNRAKKSCYKKLEFVPGVTEKVEPPFGRIRVKTCYVTETYKSNSQRENFGVLILEKPVGERLGYFGLHVNKSDGKPILEKTEIHLTGYPQKTIGRYEKMRSKQTEMKGRIVGVDATDNWIAYELEMADGSKSDQYQTGLEGAGVHYQGNNGNHYVIGVHLSYDTEMQFRIGHFLRLSDLEQIEKWVKDSNLPELERENHNDNCIRTKGLEIQSSR